MSNTLPNPNSDVAVIKRFFFEGVSVSEIAPEMRALTPADRKALAEGIRDGSLTYAA